MGLKGSFAFENIFFVNQKEKGIGFCHEAYISHVKVSTNEVDVIPKLRRLEALLKRGKTYI